MKKLKIITLLMMLSLLCHCTKKQTVYQEVPVQGRPSDSNQPAAAVNDLALTPAPASEIDDGGSSGGGSFGDESSMFILNRAIKELSSQVKNASPGIFAELPRGWSQKSLSDLIASTTTRFNQKIFRYDRELMFDYQKNDDGSKKLVATNLFFRSHSSIPVNNLSYWELKPYVSEVKLKLAHEAAHLLGIGVTEASDPEARAFSKALMRSLESDQILCHTEEAACELFRTHGYLRACNEKKGMFEFPKSRKAVWIFNRGSGFGVSRDVFFRRFGENAVPISLSYRDGAFSDTEGFVSEVDLGYRGIGFLAENFKNVEFGYEFSEGEKSRVEKNVPFPFYYPFSSEHHNYWTVGTPGYLYYHDWSHIKPASHQLNLSTDRAQISYFFALRDGEWVDLINFESPGPTIDKEKKVIVESRLYPGQFDTDINGVKRTEMWLSDSLEIKYDKNNEISSARFVVEEAQQSLTGKEIWNSDNFSYEKAKKEKFEFKVDCQSKFIPL